MTLHLWRYPFSMYSEPEFQSTLRCPSPKLSISVYLPRSESPTAMLAVEVVIETPPAATSKDYDNNYDPKAAVVPEHIVFPFSAQNFFPTTPCGE